MAVNRKISLILLLPLIILSLFARPIQAQEKKTLVLDNFDSLNRRMTDSGSVWYGYGNIRLRVDSTRIKSDSMIWYRDYNIIHFFGRAEAYDSIQHIAAEQLSYYHRDSTIIARRNVVLIHSADSVKAESNFAKFDRRGNIIFLEDNPRLFLNYPDSANMVEILANYLTFYAGDKSADAEDSVIITYQNTRATCGCAEFSRDGNLLTLMREPFATRDSSTIAGETMYIQFAGKGVREIEVDQAAQAYFLEEADTTSGEFSGDTKLSGENIKFYFKDDEIRKIAAAGSARSEYYPSPDDTTGAGKNFVSGDTIFIYTDHRKITKAEIIGGAEGIYITKKEKPDSAAVTPADSTAVDSLMEMALDTIPRDSLPVMAADSLVNDTLRQDSLAAATNVEDSILYRGAFLEYFAANRVIRITGDASVQQGPVSLKAGRVDYDIPGRVVLAKAKVDTADTNTRIVPLVLKDAGEEIMGSSLVFNVDTKKGKIEDATTQYENAYYRGQDLYKGDEKVFFVENGELTSCDKEEPHFHFSTSKMKIIHNDRVIARPVTLYIETIPVMRIPYYIFPLKRGRHSGILPLKLGNFEQGSRFIGNIGYYWAASDYWDIQTSLDFQENIGITLNNIFRYNKRYLYRGGVNVSYSRDRREYYSGEYRNDRWRIYGNHEQTLPYDVDFRASFEFVSDNTYSTDFLTDLEDRLNRNVTSKANFNKKFGRSSLSLSFNHTDNLDTDSRNSNLPSGSFSMPSFQPFGSGREVDGKLEKRWYNDIYIGYRDDFGFYTRQQKLTDIIRIDDSTTIEQKRRTWRDFGYLNHSVTISGSSQKVLTYVGLSPSVSLQETWYYILKSDQAHAAGIPADRPYRRGAISATLSADTKIYGTFPINLKGLQAFRHVMSPRISFGWSPAVTKNDAVRSFAGRGGGGGAQKNLGFNLENDFQAKVKKGETEKKLDLLQISSGLSYNFEAQDKKFSNLSTNIRSGLLKNINASGHLSHNLYDKNGDLDWRHPSLLSFSISGSFQARGSVADDYVRQDLTSDISRDSLGLTQGTGLDVDLTAPPLEGSGGKSEWNFNLSYNYSETKSYGVTTGRTHWVQYTFNMGLTKGWKLKYSQKYDFIGHESIDKIVDLYRNMHCWEAHFYWIPTGSRKGYYFKINVIAIPDIKVEKSESGLRGALFNR